MASDSYIRKKSIQSTPTNQTRRLIAHSHRTTSRTNPGKVRRIGKSDSDSMSEDRPTDDGSVIEETHNWENATQERKMQHKN